MTVEISVTGDATINGNIEALTLEGENSNLTVTGDGAVVNVINQAEAEQVYEVTNVGVEDPQTGYAPATITPALPVIAEPSGLLPKTFLFHIDPAIGLFSGQNEYKEIKYFGSQSPVHAAGGPLSINLDTGEPDPWDWTQSVNVLIDFT